MSKKKTTLLVVLVLVITNISTYVWTSTFGAHSGNKVIISRSEYERMKDDDKATQRQNEIEKIILNRYLRDVTTEQLNEGKLRGMLDSLNDPYSQYFNAEEYKRFSEDTAGSFAGIGVVVTPAEDNYITVVSPIDGTPASRAGIKAEDRIIKVNGEEFTAKQMNDAVKQMKGEEGTEVTVTILRVVDGKSEIKDFVLKREIIRIESVKTALIPNTDLGYMQIISFDMETYNDYRSKLTELEKQNIKGLVLDLRGNPGGLLDVVGSIADDLLPKVPIIYTQTKSGEKVYMNSDAKMDSIPLIVLIDKGSASASEILAGSLRDHKRAMLVGVTSFGKGIVQHVHDFSDGTAIKLTESEYYLPSEVCIHGVGIEPDVKVELPGTVTKIGLDVLDQDTQLQKAIQLLTKQISEQ